VCEVDELDAIVRLVANGVGVALVPEPRALDHWPSGIRAVSLGEHTFHRDIGVVYRGDQPGHEAARALIALLVEYAA